jgi:hypothetical protein
MSCPAPPHTCIATAAAIRACCCCSLSGRRSATPSSTHLPCSGHVVSGRQVHGSRATQVTEPLTLRPLTRELQVGCSEVYNHIFRHPASTYMVLGAWHVVQ